MRFRGKSYSALALIHPLVILLLSMSPTDLYICDVYACPRMVINGLITFIFFWYVIFPLADMVREHKLSMVAFHIVPLEVYCLFVFAQYHPLLAALAVLILLFGLLLAVIYSNRNHVLTRNQLKTLTARLVNYLSFGNEYLNQPLEKDSRQYAASVLPQYLPYITPTST